MKMQGRISLALCGLLLAGVLLLVDTSARAQAGVLYVSPDGACGGATPCYAVIQDAVDAAGEGDTVKVAEGTYGRPGAYIVHVTKGMAIIGGFATGDWLTSLPETQPTVLDAVGTLGRRGIVVEAGSGGPVWLEGLVVQGGLAAPAADGGGIYVAGGSVTVHRCKITANTATGTVGGGGGGVFLQAGALTIRESTILNNRSYQRGGGVGARAGTLLMVDSLVEGNTSTKEGGGVLVNGASATLRRNVIRDNSPMGLLVAGGATVADDNTVEDNQSTGNGGGIGVNGYYPTSLSASRNLIRNNSAVSGGGVGISAGTTTLYDNDIVGNTASSNGGGLAAWANGSDITLIKNRIRGNSAGSLGGGGLYVGDGDLTMERNDIQQNSAPGTSGGGLVIAGGRVAGINDVIARNNSLSEGVYLSGGTLTGRHWTLVSNGSYALLANGGNATLTNTIVATHTVAGFWGTGVVANTTLFYHAGSRCGNGASCPTYITGWPAFVDDAQGDYHIDSQSVAIDSGVDAGVDLDMDGQPRLGICDLGADEYWAPGSFRRTYLPLIMSGVQ